MSEDHFKEGRKLVKNVVQYWEQLDNQTKFSQLSEADYHLREVDSK